MEWGNTKLQHEIFFYEDSSGNKPVLDYMKELKDNGSKDSRIKLSKIQDYVKVLREYGTSAGVPYVKHLERYGSCVRFVIEYCLLGLLGDITCCSISL